MVSVYFDDHPPERIMHPSEDTVLHRTCEYFDRAKQHYAEAERTYDFLKSEEKIADIGANLNTVSKINFSIGGSFGGYCSFVVELSNGLNDFIKLWEDEEPLAQMEVDDEEPYTNILLKRIASNGV